MINSKLLIQNYRGSNYSKAARGFIWFLGILVIFWGTAAQTTTSVLAATLPPSEIQALNEWPNWVGGVSNCSAATAPTGAGGDGGGTTITITGNTRQAFDALTSAAGGYTAIQAAGIVGNLMYESADNSGDVNPTENEQGGGGGYGIAQWTPPTAMIAWVTANGGDPNSLKGQLDFLVYDLNNGNAATKAAVQSATTLDGTTAAFMTGYERPLQAAGAASLPDRELDANAVLDQAGNGAGNPTSCTGAATNCTTAVGDAKILCEAEPYAGIYYEYGGGHQGYAAFIKGCPNPKDPPNPPGNHPTGGPSLDGGLSGNPSPCATDCSALVSIAVDTAFGQTFNWVVDDIEDDTADWRNIPDMNTVQPGDVVVIDGEHVEIVDHYDAATGTLYTFGSHETGTQTGEVTSTLNNPWTAAYRYIGPGS
jgi:Phage tail lysozyme